MTGKEIISKWYIKLLIGLVGFGGLGTFIVYIGTLAYEDLQVIKDVKGIKIWQLEVNDFKKNTETKNAFLMKHVTDDINKGLKEFQVGLRFRTTNKKLYYRDINREYREVFHDATGDYYRDGNDKRVYITDKY